MSPIRKRFIKIIESLPCDMGNEIKRKDVKEILQEVTKRYVDKYGINDLSESDKECMKLLIEYKN